MEGAGRQMQRIKNNRIIGQVPLTWSSTASEGQSGEGQPIFNIFWAVLFLLALITILVGFIVWAGILYQVTLQSFEKASHEALRNLLLGLAALLGAPFIVWRTYIASQQTRINQESHYTGLFTKAIEQLGADKVVRRNRFKPKFKVDKATAKFKEDEDGNPIIATRPDGSELGDWESKEESVANLEVRLGAIYSLERIAQDSERDHWPIMETLTAYVRNNSGREIGSDDETEVPLRIDIQAALRVIGRRSSDRVRFERDQGQRLDLSACNSGNADLSGLDLSNAILSHGVFNQAQFRDADISNAEFVKTALVHAHLEQAKLENAFFASCDLTEAQFSDAKASQARFNSCQLVRSNCELADFENAVFQGGSLSQAFAEGANFLGASLNGTNLSDGTFSASSFRSVKNGFMRP